MTQRGPGRRRLCGLLLAVCAAPPFLLTGGTAAAAPPPTPATPVRSAPAPLQVVLPGLLSVSVDLPRVNIQILGAAGTARDRPPAAAPSPAAPAPTSAAATVTPRIVRPAPVRIGSAAPRSSPGRTERTDRPLAGRRTRVALPATNVADDTVRPTRPTKIKTTTPRPRTPQAAVQAFRGMLHSGVPTWLLAGVVVLCALGTVVVVRSAGRRTYRVNRQS